jgi:hypothetical protein
MKTMENLMGFDLLLDSTDNDNKYTKDNLMMLLL